MIGFPKWLLAGVVAASVGGAVWVALAYFLGVEVGYIAWGIGFLAGVGVRWAAGENGGFLPGAAAVIAAVAVVAFSKYMAVSVAMDAAFADSFGLFDLLWFGLAAFTAFGLGSGTVGDD